MSSPLSPVVSVIIPVYNRPRLLREALRSVLSQEGVFFELIPADDGSTDETPSVIRDLCRSFREDSSFCLSVKALRLPHSGFPGRVRNAGVSAASAPFITFLDSDDLRLPSSLASQLKLFREAEARNPDTILLHGREIWNREGRIISQRKQRHRRSGDVFSSALEKCMIGPSTVWMRRDRFRDAGGFREDLEIAEDYELWLRLCAEGRVAYAEEPLVIKRAGAWDQLSERYGRIELFRLRALYDLLRKDRLPAFRREEAGRKLAEQCRIYGAGCRKRGRIREASFFETLSGQAEDFSGSFSSLPPFPEEFIPSRKT